MLPAGESVERGGRRIFPDEEGTESDWWPRWSPVCAWSQNLPR